jgi:hypothetical protein
MSKSNFYSTYTVHKTAQKTSTVSTLFHPENETLEIY